MLDEPLQKGYDLVQMHLPVSRRETYPGRMEDTRSFARSAEVMMAVPVQIMNGLELH